MATPTSPVSLPEPTYTVPSTSKELRMSYGMFSDIMRLVGNAQDVTMSLINDSISRDLVLRRLFTDTKKALTSTDDLIDSFEIEILPTEIDGIIAWVADHASYFMLSTGNAMGEVLKRYQPKDPVESNENQSSES